MSSDWEASPQKTRPASRRVSTASRGGRAPREETASLSRPPPKNSPSQRLASVTPSVYRKRPSPGARTSRPVP